MKTLFKFILVLSVVFILPKLSNAQSQVYAGGSTPTNILVTRNISKDDSAHEFGIRDTSNHAYQAGTMIAFRGQPWWWDGIRWYELFGDTASDIGQVNSDWNASSGVAQILNKPTLATVAISGSYNDLGNKPTIPAAQVNSDWNAVSGLSQILNEPRVLDSIYRTPGKDSIYFVIRHGSTLTTYRILDSLGSGGGGGSGVVDSIAVGNLSPLFSSSVTNNNTVKPSISFTLNNFGAYGVLMNNTNASAQPTVVTPTSTVLNQWFGGSGIQGTINLTTNGSGAATFVSNTLNIPTNSGGTPVPDTVHFVTYGTGKNITYPNSAGNIIYARTWENSANFSVGYNTDSSLFGTVLITPTGSITNNGGLNWSLVNDNPTPVANSMYMTNSSAVKGWNSYTNIPVATSSSPGLESTAEYSLLHFPQTVVNAGTVYDSIFYASPTLDSLYGIRFNFIGGSGINISKTGSIQGLNQYTISATGGGSSNTLTNSGSGFRLVEPLTSGNYPINSLFPGTNIAMDSTTHSGSVMISANTPTFQQVLAAGSTLTVPETVFNGANTFKFSGPLQVTGLIQNGTYESGSYTLQTTDNIVFCNFSTPDTIYLPTNLLGGSPNSVFTITNTNTVPVVINAGASFGIGMSGSAALSQYLYLSEEGDAVTIQVQGGNWWSILSLVRNPNLYEIGSAITMGSGLGYNYSFTGSSAITWTLPLLTYFQRTIPFTVKNVGTATLTINAGGSDHIFTTSSVTSITVAAGASVKLYPGPTYWYSE